MLHKLRDALKNSIYCTALLRKSLEAVYRAGGYRPWSTGYSFYKYGYVRDAIARGPAIFRAPQLPDGYGRGLDERAVEYPWFFARLNDDQRRILDAGSSLNHHDLLNLPLWRGRQLHIATLAWEGCPPAAVKPVYTYEDLRAMGYPNEFFDAVVCISTLEHVGMDNTFLYTDDPAKKEDAGQSHLDAVDEMKRVLKDGGTFYLTMPYGVRHDHGWFQVFDAAMIDAVIAHFAPRELERTYYKYEHRQWTVAGAKACKDGYYVDIHARADYNSDSPAASQCVVCLRMVK